MFGYKEIKMGNNSAVIISRERGRGGEGERGM